MELKVGSASLSSAAFTGRSTNCGVPLKKASGPNHSIWAAGIRLASGKRPNLMPPTPLKGAIGHCPAKKLYHFAFLKDFSIMYLKAKHPQRHGPIRLHPRNSQATINARGKLQLICLDLPTHAP